MAASAASSAANQDPSQRDKIVFEMKKELKKLQRLREQVEHGCPPPAATAVVAHSLPLGSLHLGVPGLMLESMRVSLQVRGWLASGEIKDDSQLTEARKAIEREMVSWRLPLATLCRPAAAAHSAAMPRRDDSWMAHAARSGMPTTTLRRVWMRPCLAAADRLPQERFKWLEKELKIKQFSSAGLSRDSTDPLMMAKVRTADWLNDMVCSLETQASKRTGCQPAPLVRLPAGPLQPCPPACPPPCLHVNVVALCCGIS